MCSREDSLCLVSRTGKTGNYRREYSPGINFGEKFGPAKQEVKKQMRGGEEDGKMVIR